jgi:hypothetical protein
MPPLRGSGDGKTSLSSPGRCPGLSYAAPAGLRTAESRTPIELPGVPVMPTGRWVPCFCGRSGAGPPTPTVPGRKSMLARVVMLSRPVGVGDGGAGRGQAVNAGQPAHRVPGGHFNSGRSWSLFTMSSRPSSSRASRQPSKQSRFAASCSCLVCCRKFFSPCHGPSGWNDAGCWRR